jgi:hypothetical protein
MPWALLTKRSKEAFAKSPQKRLGLKNTSPPKTHPGVVLAFKHPKGAFNYPKSRRGSTSLWL